MLPEKTMRMIGLSSEPKIFEVEPGAIKKYADAVGDSNPLYWDHEYARTSRFGSTIAPPGFWGWPTRWSSPSPFMPENVTALLASLAEGGFPRVLDGGSEYEFNQPVYANDRLTVVAKVTSVEVRDGRQGKKAVAGIEISYTNQHGVRVATLRQTLIAY